MNKNTLLYLFQCIVSDTGEEPIDIENMNTWHESFSMSYSRHMFCILNIWMQRKIQVFRQSSDI
jgi:hypothetical protein